jgi:hypothetical protein
MSMTRPKKTIMVCFKKFKKVFNMIIFLTSASEKFGILEDPRHLAHSKPWACCGWILKIFSKLFLMRIFWSLFEQNHLFSGPVLPTKTPRYDLDPRDCWKVGHAGKITASIAKEGPWCVLAASITDHH